MADAENRFAHLLQPIRNMADNWDIDIAAELQEYLQELEKITFTFDGVAKTLNFAEAALLIQGSTCIYSKKVEYLYQLVYQTLDLLATKKKQVEAAKNGEAVDADAAAEFRNEEVEFLTLDDIKEADNIDLDDSEPLARTRRALSMARAPLALMPLSAEEGTSDGTKRTDFRMNTCAVHASGALLLEDERKMREDALKDRRVSLRPKDNILVGNVDLSEDESDEEADELRLDDKTKDKAKEGEGEKEKEGDKDKEKEGEADKDKDKDKETGAVNKDGSNVTKINETMGKDKTLEMTLNQRGPLDKSKAVSFALDDDDDDEDDDDDDEDDGKGKKKGRGSGRKSMDAADDVDLWATMDPHSNQGVRAKPFKKGKTFRTPVSLGGKPSARGSGKDGGKKQDEASVAAADGAGSDMVGGNEMSVKVRGPYLPEFNYLYIREMKRRLKARKAERDAAASSSILKDGKRKKKRDRNRRASASGDAAVLMMAANGTFGDGEEGLPLEYLEGEEVMAAIERMGGEARSFMQEVGSAAAAVPSVAAAAAGFDPLDGGGLEDNDDSVDGPDDEAMGGWVADPIALEYDAAGPSGSAAGTGVAEGEIVQSYEALCKRHIESYLASAEAYAVETALSRRVADWKDKLEPVLSEQEERKPFDIHSYGSDVMKRFNKTRAQPHPVLTFGHLVDEEEEVFEICRVFAATLQLANNGNVEIMRHLVEDDLPEDANDDGEGVGRMDLRSSFKLKLLSDEPVTFESTSTISLAVEEQKPAENGDEEGGVEKALSGMTLESDGDTSEVEGQSRSARKKKRKNGAATSDAESSERGDVESESEAEKAKRKKTAAGKKPTKKKKGAAKSKNAKGKGKGTGKGKGKDGKQVRWQGKENQDPEAPATARRKKGKEVAVDDSFDTSVSFLS